MSCVDLEEKYKDVDPVSYAVERLWPDVPKSKLYPEVGEGPWDVEEDPPGPVCKTDEFVIPKIIKIKSNSNILFIKALTTDNVTIVWCT